MEVRTSWPLKDMCRVRERRRRRPLPSEPYVKVALPGGLPLDQCEATVDELLSGSWFGNWSRAGDCDGGVFLRSGILTLPMNPPAKLRLRIEDEGKGRFTGLIGA